MAAGAAANGFYGQGPLAGMFDNGGGQPPQPWNPQAVQNQNINNMTDKLASNERRIGDELSKALSAYGGAGNSRGSRPSAGSSVLAQGPAAQNMVGAMQLQASLDAGKAQARKAMNPANTYQY